MRENLFHKYKNKAKSLTCKHLLQINNKKYPKPHKAIPQKAFKWRTDMLPRITHEAPHVSTCLHPCTYNEGCHGFPLSPWVFV